MFCPEEICTLVIAEAFPEDGGLFSCSASNPYGSVNCTAHLTVTAGWYEKRHQEGEGGGRVRGGGIKFVQVWTNFMTVSSRYMECFSDA